ncbi:MAG: lipopolysaccharide transport periplasmic protein LptA [Deltaproteobacteria bacterium]|nr:lipopolysaccharide transport periplasmic protein LptA [Deltaproteobacteria bacterium]MBW2118747.1 lipopolysaccharide transport periplasmic protein LptA [Deltaproteobacteria bacterium]MBW2342779.1 lipopolysaccharide transport periplasmic protein LptA [Deltaproteobacteria bacterium]
MEDLKCKPFFLLMIVLFGLLLPCFAGSETLKEELGKGGSKEMVIKSNKLEVDDNRKVVIFTGDVDAKREDFVINCKKLVVFYKSLPGSKEPGKGKTEVDKIVATGHVKITHAQGGSATAEKAVYYQRDEKVVLTQNPVVKRGNDFVEGDRITMYLKENRSVVESSGDRKVRAIIYPKSKKK